MIRQYLSQTNEKESATVVKSKKISHLNKTLVSLQLGSVAGGLAKRTPTADEPAQRRKPSTCSKHSSQPAGRASSRCVSCIIKPASPGPEAGTSGGSTRNRRPERGAASPESGSAQTPPSLSPPRAARPRPQKPPAPVRRWILPRRRIPAALAPPRPRCGSGGSL